MKIGILTFHSAHNFGAMLQAYALQEQIKANGHEVWIINYRPQYIYRGRPALKRWMFTHGRAMGTIKRYFRITRKEQKSYDKFEGFANSNMHLTANCHTHSELSQVCCEFDCIILGSDQIWNQEFNGNDVVWFGEISGFRGKFILYAVSAGSKGIDEELKKLFGKNLHKFSAISVREKNLVLQIAEIATIFKDIQMVLDPSLMVNPNLWKKWQEPIRTDKYVVTYQARKDDNVYRIAKNIANQISPECKIVSVDFWENSFRKGIENVVVSPSEFVSLVNNAQCVITTSFHGTAFSIICNTPFYTIRLNDGADGRSEELLNNLNLFDRMVDKSASPIFMKLDSEHYKSKLEEWRSLSQKFLNISIHTYSV